ncbi:hypothetical protein AK812_SmicGene323 [Symbiodinium microadriaticum]|uniref:Uncharacterized protein n=1 Tax=Symbiodinium microadriaticum TaxID=2951 RepID=A0A1Q9F6T5_SYMMI|nr:hypothetical protein AK812_SmicGene323 [Symbiodinium microadriaticum]
MVYHAVAAADEGRTVCFLVGMFQPGNGYAAMVGPVRANAFYEATILWSFYTLPGSQARGNGGAKSAEQPKKGPTRLAGRLEEKLFSGLCGTGPDKVNKGLGLASSKVNPDTKVICPCQPKRRIGGKAFAMVVELMDLVYSVPTRAGFPAKFSLPRSTSAAA